MSKCKIVKMCMTICLAVSMMVLSIDALEVQAADAVVQGTILSGTTSDLLKISTKEGNMEIKLDSGTDTSSCKILLPGKKINVSVSHGSDGYMHAVKLSTGTLTQTVALDASTIATVTGTISEKTQGDIIYFNTPQGEMQIKLDTTTNVSGCSVLVAGKSYSITCMRGADAYMHATSISDSTAATIASTTASTSTLTPAPSTGTNTNTATMSITGTVSSNTKEDILYLTTKDGEMQFKIDSSTDASSGMVLAPENKLTVSFYHGSDAYLHAVSIVGNKNGSSGAQIDTSNIATVTGTVGSKSTQNVLFLNTAQGEMELKLDAVNSVSNLKVLVSGKQLTVTCARGSDAYMHALTIVGK